MDLADQMALCEDHIFVLELNFVNFIMTVKRWRMRKSKLSKKLEAKVFRLELVQIKREGGYVLEWLPSLTFIQKGGGV